MKAYTDYPIEELGDTPGQLSPIRECTVYSYDGNKYCSVEVEGVRKQIKAGYIYQAPGRVSETPSLTRRQLIQLTGDCS